MFTLKNTRIFPVVFIICLLMQAPALLADEINLSANKDNTIYSEGDLSNGVGDHLFSGTNNRGDFRRALIQFDIAAGVPAGATIDTVQLTLSLSREPDAGLQNFSLFRLVVAWGEGNSNAPGAEGGGTGADPGDATWSHTFFRLLFWNTKGGDIVADASVTALIGGLGPAIWPSGDAMVADVQNWLDQPETNFGWLLTGDETTLQTAKRFESRENPVAGLRPRLQILYSPPTGACCSVSGVCSDVQSSVCQASGGFFKSPGSSCAQIQECPVFQDSFEN